MESIRVQNLRSLADTGVVELKSMTLLVGANSSGKSTFLRVLPLLRQSVETRTMSGLLLNEGYVNFGFFPEVVRKGAEQPRLKFEFDLVLRAGAYRALHTNTFLLGALPVHYRVNFAPRPKDQRYAYLRSVCLHLGEAGAQDVIELKADEDGVVNEFRVNDYEAEGQAKRLRLHGGRGIVPSLGRTLSDRETTDQLLGEDISEASPFWEEMLRSTSGIFHGKTLPQTRLEIFRNIRLGTAEEMLIHMRTLGNVATWHQRLASWTTETPDFKRLRNLVLAEGATNLLAGVGVYLAEFARSVHYFAPVRASAERDYLSRDVQTSSVDPHGTNVAMVLSSLGSGSLRTFREWTAHNFGFEVFPRTVGDGARVALRLLERSSGVEFNLADMGFGYSQILPFLVQLWALTERKDSRRRAKYGWHLAYDSLSRGYVMAIEQPELHLHPAMQSRLADVFVTMIRLSREQEFPIRFVLETHSPTIIERIGQLVEGGRLAPSDVQVLLFERGLPGKDPNISEIRTACFDEAGILQDWPYGFLQPNLPLPEPVVSQASTT